MKKSDEQKRQEAKRAEIRQCMIEAIGPGADIKIIPDTCGIVGECDNEVIVASTEEVVDNVMAWLISRDLV